MAHAHTRAHAPARHDRAFAIGIGLNVVYVVVEATFGVLGLMLAWGAAWLSRRLPTQRRTYGYRRSSILASLGNAMLLLVAVGAITWEAARRLLEPQPVDSATILWVAAVGVAVNAGTAFMFMSGRKSDLNIRGAFLHMAADAGVTVGVIAAAVLIGWTGWLWLDPAVSLVIAAAILVGTWGLLRDSVNLSLDAVPEAIDPRAVEAYLASQPGVREVHDLHIWAMSTTETALTVHLVRPGGGAQDDLLERLRGELHDRFGIEHATIQIETGDPAHPCPLAPARVV